MTRIGLLIVLSLTACSTAPRQDGPMPPPCCIDSGYGPGIDTGLATPWPPIAVCRVDANPVAPPSQTANFEGAASFSPSGLDIVGVEWSLSLAPDGNGAALSRRTGTTTSITPQLAGEYWIELSVIDELGIRSEQACVIVLRALPTATLQVEMFWSHSGDDMDLHVIRPGGTARTLDDCFADNCRDGLDWGVVGEPSDDVQMVRSDDTGVGPEIIHLQTSELGDFRVFVHDNPAAERPEPTDVTVNIVLNDEVAFSQTRRITGEDSDTPFATVNLTTGIVTPAL